jgi:hypothetical protein
MTDMDKVGKLLKQRKGCSSCNLVRDVKHGSLHCVLDMKMGISLDFVCRDFKEVKNERE